MASIDNNLQTQTLDLSLQKMITCQTLNEIVSTQTIKPNTKHTELKQRLCVSAITSEYCETYRPEGIVFETTDNPSYAVPFDLMMLTKGITFTSSDYNASFLPKYQKLVYSDVKKMLKITPEIALKKLNEFRKESGLEEVATKKYNEVCFEKEIKIIPKALIGTSKETKDIASKYNLPHYTTIKEYLTI